MISIQASRRSSLVIGLNFSKATVIAILVDECSLTVYNIGCIYLMVPAPVPKGNRSYIQALNLMDPQKVGEASSHGECPPARVTGM